MKKENKNLIIGLATLAIIAFVAGWLGTKVGSLTTEAKEVTPEVNYYEVQARACLDEEMDYTELEGLKSLGKIKDYSTGLESTDVTAIYHMFCKIELIDGNDLTIHYLYDVMEDDGIVYFTMNGVRISEDVADALSDQIDG